MILWAVLTVVLALTLGRSAIIWGFLAYSIGWPILLVVFLLGFKGDALEKRTSFFESIETRIKESNERIDQLVKPKGYEDFNTVEDLFKQLEPK